jgi:hypothetical protein
MRKIIYLILLSFFACQSFKNENDLKTVTKLNDGKNIIDFQIQTVKASYDGLCSGIRNDNVKMEFAELQVELRKINELGYEFELLSYNDQLALLKYANEQIEKEQSLNTLMNNATVDCW